MSSFSASMLTFLVFVLSSLIMVVQLASAQLTPRIMAITFSDIQAKIMTCTLLFSFLFGTAILGRIEDGHVPLIGIKVGIISVLVCIILFLRFIPHLGMSLRPISLMRRIAEERTICRRGPLSPRVRHSGFGKAESRADRSCCGKKRG